MRCPAARRALSRAARSLQSTMTSPIAATRLKVGKREPVHFRTLQVFSKIGPVEAGDERLVVGRCHDFAPPALVLYVPAHVLFERRIEIVNRPPAKGAQFRGVDAVAAVVRAASGILDSLEQ